MVARFLHLHPDCFLKVRVRGHQENCAAGRDEIGVTLVQSWKRSSYPGPALEHCSNGATIHACRRQGWLGHAEMSADARNNNAAARVAILAIVRVMYSFRSCPVPRLKFAAAAARLATECIGGHSDTLPGPSGLSGLAPRPWRPGVPERSKRARSRREGATCGFGFARASY